jgi:hypothetical protein
MLPRHRSETISSRRCWKARAQNRPGTVATGEPSVYSGVGLSGEGKFMHRRILQMSAAAAVAALGITVGTVAFAASDHESCSTTSTDVTSSNMDGTEANCDAAIGPPNSAKAKASKVGEAQSIGEDGGKADSSASGGKAFAQGENAGSATAEQSGTGMAQATANGGKATAKAMGGASSADASATAGGKGTATAMKGGGATAEGDSGGNATSTSSGVGSNTSSFAENSGNAKAKATGAAEATATAEASCKANATADADGSVAGVACSQQGSSVSAEATKGSKAIGSDTSTPTCTPMNGGIAKVKSPMGNCG